MHRRATWLTFAVFLLQPLPFGAWLALIPLVKETLGLDKAQLAYALLGLPIGLLPMLHVAGRLMSVFGPRRVLAVTLPVNAGLSCLPLFATGVVSLFAALAAVGMVVALMQVSLNVYAGRLEKHRGLTVMSRAHGFWALGVATGSALMAALSGLGTLTGFLAIAILSAALGAWAALSLEKLPGLDGGTSAPRRHWREIPRVLPLIALVTLAVSMTEGAMSDWAAVYLAERLGDPTGGGLAVTIFASFLALGRFLGDAARLRFGAVALARAVLVCAIAGLGCLVLPLPLFAAYLGFALVGLGASVGFPLGISAAAALDDTFEGPNIAFVSTVTMLGFLVGPPLIGGLAESFGLRVGLSALLPGLILGLVFARALEIRPRRA